MPLREVLILFGRAPIAGQCKTRLGRALASFDAAAAIYRELVALVVARVQPLYGRGARVVFSCASSADCAQCARMLEDTGSEHVPCVRAQADVDDLGVRMTEALREAFSDGADVACVAGTDIPNFCAAHAEQCFALLTQGADVDSSRGCAVDVVFGPARDGGFYCVAARRGVDEALRRAFEGVQWSTPNTLECCLAGCAREGLSVNVTALPRLRDVDELEDLEEFIAEASEADVEFSRIRRLADILRTNR